MTALETALADYLALRRSLGYKLERGSELLTDFVDYLDQQGADHATVELAVTWATLPVNPESRWRAQRLGMVCCFARYLNALEPHNEVPPTRLLPPGTTRPAPFLYSEAEVARLMAAARGLRTLLYDQRLEVRRRGEPPAVRTLLRQCRLDDTQRHRPQPRPLGGSHRPRARSDVHDHQDPAHADVEPARAHDHIWWQEDPALTEGMAVGGPVQHDP